MQTCTIIWTCLKRFIKSVVTDVLENCDEDMQLFFNYVDKDLQTRLVNLIENPFERSVLR